MCSRSAVKIGRPLISRRTTDSNVSRIGNPNETTGMATATNVGAFCAPARANALSMKPMNRLPESPRKIVAGLKLKRRNPRMAPARVTLIREPSQERSTIDTTKTTIVENKADPAAKPSKPSMRLKALVTATTHNTVSGNPTNQGSEWDPKISGRPRTRMQPAKSMAAATTATLAGTSGKTTYICGYSIRANATAAATVTNTITGVITATLSSLMWVAPLASGIGVDEQI